MKRIKVILVEKNATFLNIVKSFLENEINCEIIGEAHNYEAFIKMKNIHIADAIFFDIDSDGSDGSEIQSAIRVMRNMPALNVIALSNSSNSGFQELLITLGFKSVIHKKSFYVDAENAFKQEIEGKIVVNK